MSAVGSADGAGKLSVQGRPPNLEYRAFSVCSRCGIIVLFSVS